MVVRKERSWQVMARRQERFITAPYRAGPPWVELPAVRKACTFHTARACQVLRRAAARSSS